MIEKGDIVITRGGFVGTVIRVHRGTATVWMDFDGNVNRIENYKVQYLRVAAPEEVRAEK